MNGFQKFLHVVDDREENFFDCNNFFSSGHISIFFSDLIDQKMVGVKKKSFFFMPISHAKEFSKFVYTGAVFSQFLARASNGPRPSHVKNWCLKICTGIPEDMLLTNRGVNHCKSIIRFAL